MNDNPLVFVTSLPAVATTSRCRAVDRWGGPCRRLSRLHTRDAIVSCFRHHGAAVIARRVSCADYAQTKSFESQTSTLLRRGTRRPPRCCSPRRCLPSKRATGLGIQNTQLQLISIRPSNMYRCPSIRYERSHTNWRRIRVNEDFRMYVKAVRLLLVRWRGCPRNQCTM